MTDTTSNQMWGGRFSAGPDAIMEAINASIGFDKRLAAQDIAGSQAHAAMLAAQDIITDSDARAILEGLEQVLGEINDGSFAFSTRLEDIHMNIEARLKQVIGEPAGRLHTARSRNDQVATDFKLWVRDQFDAFESGLVALIKALLAQATAGFDWVMPGFTHLQPAQPVTFGHHLLAYVEMVGRDRGRFADCRKRVNECPLGAAALAGVGREVMVGDDVVARHAHLGTDEFQRTGDVGGSEVELRSVPGKEWGMTSAFFLRQNISFRFELFVRGDGPWFTEYLSSFNIVSLNTS